MGTNVSIKFDKYDGFLEFEKNNDGKIAIYLSCKELDVYMHTVLERADTGSIVKIKNGMDYIRCNPKINVSGWDTIDDILLLHYSQGSEFYGFIFLTKEQRHIFELKQDELRELINFLRKY